MKFQSKNSPLGSLSSWGTYFELFAFVLIGCFGIYAALTAGISYDEDAEFRTYLVNANAVSGLLNGSSEAYAHLMQYVDRYYGIGFHIFSHGLSSILIRALDGLLPFSTLGSRLIWAHLAIFVVFLGSGVLFRACLLALIKDRLIASLGMFVFLMWPYLFGHALMNVKDIPFMFGWLCCTYLAIRIFQLPVLFNRPLTLYFIALGVLTGWLISIRVSGVLVLIEYFWFALFWYLARPSIKMTAPFRTIILIGGSFFIALTGTLFIFYPILWHNPLEFIQALTYMSSHPWQGDTLTAGQLVEPKTRLIFYIFSWLIVKLPVFVFLGLIGFVIATIFDFIKGKADSRYSATWALLTSTLTIFILLVSMRVALYNELRQVLFIMPLLMLISIVGLSRMGKGIAIPVLVVTLWMMLMDLIWMRPYQYSYINELARHSEFGKKYETDYFGLSVKETAIWLNSSHVDGQSQCLYVPAKHLWDFAIDPRRFPCVEGFPGDLSLITKPFLFFVQARSVTSFRAPPWCQVLHAEERSLPFSGAKLRMGELYECLPPKSN